jgi:hypothetical protein
LRDSFVLAESTPNVRTNYPESAERRAIRKAHFDEITPIRSNKFTGFQTAAKLLSTNGGIGKANNELRFELERRNKIILGNDKRKNLVGGIKGHFC